MVSVRHTLRQLEEEQLSDRFLLLLISTFLILEEIAETRRKLEDSSAGSREGVALCFQ